LPSSSQVDLSKVETATGGDREPWRNINGISGAVARAQQAKSWELRAAMSMARLWRDQ
jgi:hypothetical protein